jgi:hypothetical protein
VTELQCELRTTAELPHDRVIAWCAPHGHLGQITRISTLSVLEQSAIADELFQAHLATLGVRRRQGEPVGYNPANIGKRESSDGVNTITVYASIGNSDDKLSQREWSEFVREMEHIVGRHASQVYGWWFSMPDAPWQNAVVAFLLDTHKADQVRAEMSKLRAAYRQDSIAWAEAPRTEFI